MEPPLKKHKASHGDLARSSVESSVGHFDTIASETEIPSSPPQSAASEAAPRSPSSLLDVIAATLEAFPLEVCCIIDQYRRVSGSFEREEKHCEHQRTCPLVGNLMILDNHFYQRDVAQSQRETFRRKFRFPVLFHSDVWLCGGIIHLVGVEDSGELRVFTHSPWTSFISSIENEHDFLPLSSFQPANLTPGEYLHRVAYWEGQIVALVWNITTVPRQCFLRFYDLDGKVARTIDCQLGGDYTGRTTSFLILRDYIYIVMILHKHQNQIAVHMMSFQSGKYIKTLSLPPDVFSPSPLFTHWDPTLGSLRSPGQPTELVLFDFHSSRLYFYSLEGDYLRTGVDAIPRDVDSPYAQTSEDVSVVTGPDTDSLVVYFASGSTVYFS